MPTTRRSSGAHSSAGSGKQSTLSFHQRVTKSVPKPGKESVVAASSATKKKSPLSKSLKPESDEEEQPQEVKEVQELAAEEEEKPELESEAETEEAETKEAASKTDAERKAEKLGDAAIEKYWRKLEAQRLAKRVHQEELSTGEKVLRYFDVSSQYGPCIGMPRLKRWQRAERLGLNPPVEVLAVLLKEEAKGNNRIEKAHMDEIMNPTAVRA